MFKPLSATIPHAEQNLLTFQEQPSLGGIRLLSLLFSMFCFVYCWFLLVLSFLFIFFLWFIACFNHVIVTLIRLMNLNVHFVSFASLFKVSFLKVLIESAECFRLTYFYSSNNTCFQILLVEMMNKTGHGSIYLY